MIGKKQYDRNVKKQKEKFSNLMQDPNLLLTSSPIATLLNLTEPSSSSSQGACEPSTEEEVVEIIHYSQNTGASLADKLRLWFLQHNPTIKCATSLLHILKSENLNVPLSVRGLLGRAPKCTERTVSPGTYIHIGLKRQLERNPDLIHSFAVNELLTDVGIDGLPIFKSSSVGLWPILGRIVNIPKCGLFMIGCYIGPKKPYNIDSFMHDFSYEISDLKDNGIIIKDEKVDVKIRALICDAPAKAFVCGIRGHMSLVGCTKCQQVGQRIDNVTTFSITAGEKRTDEDFHLRKYEGFHLPQEFAIEMKLETVGIGMVSQFPIDPMHLLDLGITKKILLSFINKKTILPLAPSSVPFISEDLMSVSSHVPREFARKPRPLFEIGRWKATEFRQMLLYTGIVVLKEHVQVEIYDHFILLHCSYRILLSSPTKTEIENAHEMIKSFVEYFPVLYGRSSVTYNVHNLLHLAECVEAFGNLDNFSSYPFEDFLQTVKRKIKMPKHVPQQIFNKFSNDFIITLKEEKFHGTKYRKGEISALFLSKGYFSCSNPDNTCLMQNKKFLKITKIVDKKKFEATEFLGLQNFYTYPINSLDLDIAYSEDEELEAKTYNFENILAKVIKLPFKNGFVLIPQIHCYKQ